MVRGIRDALVPRDEALQHSTSLIRSTATTELQIPTAKSTAAQIPASEAPLMLSTKLKVESYQIAATVMSITISCGKSALFQGYQVGKIQALSSSLLTILSTHSGPSPIHSRAAHYSTSGEWADHSESRFLEKDGREVDEGL